MSTGLERPGGPSSGLPPALLSYEGDDRAPSGARRRARIWTTWPPNPSPPFGSNHLAGQVRVEAGPRPRRGLLRQPDDVAAEAGGGARRVDRDAGHPVGVDPARRPAAR